MSTSPIQLGPFALESRIGRGGMGEIWRGTHLPQDVPVAVKVLTRKAARRDDYQRQFRNEIRSVAALDHPGIVLVFDHGEVSEEAADASAGRLVAGSPYLVMEYARYGALDTYVKGVSWQMSCHILFSVLDALSHAHARGVIHRDLKPQNILLGCAGRDGLGLKIADFGLAHPLDLTGRTGKFDSGWGTPHYMAPEQFRGLFRDYGTHTDLYALGIVAWELVTGELPYEGKNVVEISGGHLHSELPDFEPRFEIPEGFRAWVGRLLEKSIFDRFETAADAAYALARLSGHSRATFDVESSDQPLHSATSGLTQPSSGETIPLRPPAHDPEADTLLERGATTKILETPVLGESRHDHVTFDVGNWTERASGEHQALDIDFDDDGELAPKEPPPLPHDWRQGYVEQPSPQLLGAGLGLYGMRTVPLVDRDVERDWLWEMLWEVHRFHEARLAVLEGRAGTGKSRLARWLCERAAEVGGGEVLTAVHSPVDGPADGIEAMVARHFGCVGLERDEINRRLERILRAHGVTEPYEWNALTELISPAGEHAPSDTVRITTTRQRHALLRRMLERMARERPVILWLDDVQWGSDALGLVEHLLDIQRATRSPIMIVLTVRKHELEDRPVARALLKRVLRARQSQLTHIDRLSDDDTSELVRRLLRLEGELAEQVEARSAGNPLFAVQLVGDWVASGKLTVGATGFCLREGRAAAIPDDIHQLWGDRLARIFERRDDSDQRALELAAVLGQEVDEREWQKACSVAGHEASAGLQEALLSRGLIRPFDGGWRFVHGMLRESLERMARESGRWGAFNATCAQALAELYEATDRHSAERRAHYLLEAGLLNEALEPLLQAARFRAERSDLAVAHELLDRHAEALEDSDAPKAGRQTLASWVLRSQVFELEADYTEALTWARMAVQQARGRGWADLLAPALRAEGRAQLRVGAFDEAESAYSEALEIARADEDSSKVGRSLLGRARVAENRGQFDAANDYLEEAVELLEQTDDDLGTARCYNALGDIARQTDRLDDARRYCDQARLRFESAGNQLGVADCLNDLSELYLLEGNIKRAESLCRDAIELYESLGSQKSMRVRLHLAGILLDRQDIEEARQIAAQSRQHFEREGQRGKLAHADVLLLVCSGFSEDWLAWDELFEEAESIRAETGLCSPQIAHAAALAAETAARQQQSERAERARSLAERFQTGG
jgi:eukaryotic-like serine/threonine-protein kinase